MIDNKKHLIKITLIRSTIGVKKSHLATVRGLGLKKLNSSFLVNDTLAIRGMIRKVDYLLKCE